ncbi:MAG: hypothetical protein FJ387_15505 [Verrucomicrobia bacterium]|nr:hypothetical protein [Verrucomicrobiota bacterium]
MDPIANVTARVGETIRLNPAYFDPDNTNRFSGDDNRLTVEFSGWMTAATRTVRSADAGLQYVTVTVRDDGNPPLSAQRTVQVTVQVPPLRFGPVQRRPDGIWHLTLEGVAHRNCALEYSSNLLNWTVVTNVFVTNVFVTNNVVELALPFGPHSDRGFYRAKDDE